MTHIDDMSIWECPCTECLHLDYEVSDDGQLPTVRRVGAA